MALYFPKLSTVNFTFDFFEKRSVHSLYQSILNNTNGSLFFNKNFHATNSSNFVEIKLIPSYLTPDYSGLPSSTKILKFFRTSGYIVNLEGFTNVDDYMTSKMQAKNRSKIRNRVKRLEKCFDIKYKFYFGEITQKEYDLIFERLEFLIKRRFEQRGDIHQRLKKWVYYKKNSYRFILEKRASLFVIYDRDKPIDICLNYHYENIVNHSIKTYDIDYAKFSLGNIDIYKQLEWCFENNFKIFDFMWGGLEYKDRWCNEVYLYENHLFYNKNYFLGPPLAYLIVNLYKLKDSFNNKIGIRFLRQLKSPFKKEQNHVSGFTDYSIEVIDFPYMDESENLIQIDINTEEYNFLRKPIYDFQFVHIESSKDVRVYKMKKEIESYIIISKKNIQKIVFK